jgi:hypothetical protein
MPTPTETAARGAPTGSYLDLVQAEEAVEIVGQVIEVLQIRGPAPLVRVDQDAGHFDVGVLDAFGSGWPAPAREA